MFILGIRYYMPWINQDLKKENIENEAENFAGPPKTKHGMALT